jgi:hypothetical protein
MHQKSIYVKLSVALVMGTLVGGIWSKQLLEKAATARNQESGTKQRWEYCVIVGAFSMGGEGGGIKYVARICYLNGSGCQIEDIDGSDAKNALQKAIAKLGEGGWEMVGGDSFDKVLTSLEKSQWGAMHFKRPRA